MLPTDNEKRRKILMIDSKSFYASCESIARGLNPMRSFLVVMSEAKNTNGGLVLAASPQAKKVLGISNVMRKRDLPQDSRLIIVKPRMNAYIAMNKKVNDIFRTFVAEEDLQLYSIDESFLDVTDSWEYLKSIYGNDLTLQKLARIIQLKVKKALGLYLTVGIGETNVMAKLALDIEAKHNYSLIAEWHFTDLPKKLWSITDLTQVWSIGAKTEKKLKQHGYNSVGDIATSYPYKIKAFLGVQGNDLYALAWGVDRSRIKNKYIPETTSIGNSQVLPRDYYVEAEIKNVIREIGEQVASRLRAKHLVTQVVSISIGFGFAEEKSGFTKQLKITPTNNSKQITSVLFELFDSHYQHEVVRNIAISAGKLIPNSGEQLDLFQPVQTQINQSQIEKTIDHIRSKYGTTALIKLSSKGKGGTMIERANLVGGHNGGNAFG